MSEPFIDTMIDAREDAPVIRVALGLTAYLAEPEFWAREGAQRALDLMLQASVGGQLRYYTTSVMTQWQAAGPKTLQGLRQGLSSRILVQERPRHFMFFRLADVPNCPSVGFSYTEIDPRRDARSAVLELTLPQAHPPEELLALAIALGKLGPLHSLVGGYVARWNVLHQKTAFNQFYLWAQRYLGLDIQDAEELAAYTPSALPGSNWLTLVSARVAGEREFELAALQRVRWQESVTVAPVGEGLLLRAGERPTLGDLNRLSYPQAYAEVARQLEPLFVEEPPEFWGQFTNTARTGAWLRRLVGARHWSA
ncbi:type VI immunity family protein [Hyalangium versicolor]|uniref:type VI immunity family protein n=1 Tax=Hyalangium versicolor TaxID=2861190 RepID=UPI001CCB8512|nr:type VI immunity family protein [Hyalangium versicolor]